MAFRKPRSVIGAVAAAIVLLLLPGCDGGVKGNWREDFGVGSRTRATWDGGPDDWVELAADSRHPQSGCTTIWFDWEKDDESPVNHFDPRAARDCHTGTTMNAGRKWSDDYEVQGIQKAARCSTSAQPPTNCKARPGSTDIGSFADWDDVSCISTIRRASNGNLSYNPGGIKDRCDA